MDRYDAFPLRPDRIIWRFRTSGGDGPCTRPFVEFDEALRNEVRSRLGVRVEEEPVLAFILRPDHWTVLTTRRLSWIESGMPRDLPLHDIVGVGVNAFALAAAGGKAGLRYLVVVSRGGSEHAIEVEPGPPLFGFWNVLRTVVRVMSRDESPVAFARTTL